MQDNNKGKNTLVTRSCVLSDAWAQGVFKDNFWLCDKGPSLRRGLLAHGNDPAWFYGRLRASHYSFILIHKCPFVKKQLKNTITDTLTVKNSRFEKGLIFFFYFVKSLLRMGFMYARALKNRLCARAYWSRLRLAVTYSYELRSAWSSSAPDTCKPAGYKHWSLSTV